ncbi:MAG TPA: MBL fold metallo-hydrolase [Candidatus Acidoferrales bacterium]|nr:MBL fold metallo-hydrolase [Candidatus Acidoferrales bacterium]
MRRLLLSSSARLSPSGEGKREARHFSDFDGQMEVRFLGTGTPEPDPERGSSAILVDLRSARILLDCGRHCVQQLARMAIPVGTITHCFLTHGHYDHIADYGLLVLTSWRFGRRHTLKVFGPPATKAMSDALFGEVYKIDIAARKSLKKSRALPDIAVEARDLVDGEVVEGDGWRIRAVEVAHWPIPVSLGFLLEGEGKRIFFTGDTSPCDAVREHAGGVDLLIHEAMYFPEESGHYRSHSHPRKAAEVARQAGARRLVLTHLQPGVADERLLDDAGKEFAKEITIAKDRMTLTL